MKNKDNPTLRALVAVMALVPAHRRAELEGPCRTILDTAGVELDDHRYLFDKRPKRHITQRDGAFIQPRLAERCYRFTLNVVDGDQGNHSTTEHLAAGLTSLDEVSRFVNRTAHTVEMWLVNRARTIEGVTTVSHNRLDGYGHVVSFWYDDDADTNLPGLFDAVAHLGQQVKTSARKKY